MKLVIFDMDGTLVDSQKGIAESINYTREWAGLARMGEAEITRIINDPRVDAVKLLYGREDYPATLQATFETHYHDQCLKGLSLFDGIDTMLELLASQNYKLAVATNATRDFAKRMLGNIGVAHYFEDMIGASCVAKAKPAPDMLLELLKRFDLSSNQALFVGDSGKDIQSAKNAQIKSVFVNWGYGVCEGLADHRIGRPTELLKILLQG